MAKGTAVVMERAKVVRLVKVKVMGQRRLAVPRSLLGKAKLWV